MSATEQFTIPDRIECGDIARRVGMTWTCGPVPPKLSVVVRIAKRVVNMRDSGEGPYISDLSDTFFKWGVRFNYTEEN
ncbi:hypothetical protein [Gordonia sputi]|uniref:hypothetical protein n=1 Tax=Gordonia sputi TaxID=36823 RepID=UPI00367E3DC3